VLQRRTNLVAILYYHVHIPWLLITGRNVQNVHNVGVFEGFQDRYFAQRTQREFFSVKFLGVLNLDKMESLQSYDSAMGLVKGSENGAVCWDSVSRVKSR
jgi:hypothetical protein